MTVLVISHSQLDAYLQCGAKYKWAFVEKLQSKKEKMGLSRGSCGHLFMETFLKAILDGKPTEIAKMNAISAIASDPWANYHTTMTVPIMNRCIEWVDTVWPTLGWKIVAVEKEYRLKINPTLVFPLKVDAIVEIAGKLYIVDHKFLYDPYSDTVMALQPQLPKYAGALRKLGIPIKDVLYNQLRTRKTDKDVFKQVYLNLTDARIKNSMLEQILGMMEIENGSKQLLRTANKMNCDNCSFAELCIADLNGEETKYIRAHSYEPNDYGYEEEISD